VHIAYQLRRATTPRAQVDAHDLPTTALPANLHVRTHRTIHTSGEKKSEIGARLTLKQSIVRGRGQRSLKMAHIQTHILYSGAGVGNSIMRNDDGVLKISISRITSAASRRDRCDIKRGRGHFKPMNSGNRRVCRHCLCSGESRCGSATAGPATGIVAPCQPAKDETPKKQLCVSAVISPKTICTDQMVLETASSLGVPAPQPLPAPLVFSAGANSGQAPHHLHTPLARFSRPVPVSLLPSAPHHPSAHFSAAAAAHFSAHFGPYAGKLPSRFPFSMPPGFLHHPAGPRFAAVAAASLAAAAAAAAAANTNGAAESSARRVAALHQQLTQHHAASAAAAAAAQDDRVSGDESPKKGPYPTLFFPLDSSFFSSFPL